MMMLVIGFGRTMIPSTYLHNMVLRFEICACARSAPLIHLKRLIFPPFLLVVSFLLSEKVRHFTCYQRTVVCVKHVTIIYQAKKQSRDHVVSKKTNKKQKKERESVAKQHGNH